MILYKNVLGKYFWPQAGITFVFIMLSFFLIMASTGMAASQPKTVAEIALYRGPDREKILIDGARKEGRLIFYTVHTWFVKKVGHEFEKKYPFIKVAGWRSSSTKLLQRIMAEYDAKRYNVDVFTATAPAQEILQREDILQEYYSPETRYFADKLKAKGKNGVYWLAHRESYNSLAFNTDLISPAEAPKSLKDYLDPRWKGKISIPGSGTGIRWVGNTLEVMGPDFMERFGRQNVRVQNMSGAAMATLVVAGEVPLSTCISDSNIAVAKRQGAPVEWRPLEPVVSNVAYSGMTTKALHPHAAILFLDYIHSKEGQKVLMQGGMSSPREDMSTIDKKFEKTIFETKYSVEEYMQKYNEWERLMYRLFIRR